MMFPLVWLCVVMAWDASARGTITSFGFCLDGATGPVLRDPGLRRLADAWTPGPSHRP